MMIRNRVKGGENFVRGMWLLTLGERTERSLVRSVFRMRHMLESSGGSDDATLALPGLRMRHRVNEPTKRSDDGGRC